MMADFCSDYEKIYPRKIENAKHYTDLFVKRELDIAVIKILTVEESVGQFFFLIFGMYTYAFKKTTSTISKL